MKNKKELGQNWLKNRAILDEIAREAGEGECCIEIGPGLGTLTSSLLRRFKKVIAVEYDEDLARKLPKSFPGKDLEVINEDFLRFDIAKAVGGQKRALLHNSYKRVADTSGFGTVSLATRRRRTKLRPRACPEDRGTDRIRTNYATKSQKSPEVEAKKYVIAGNIPYYITSPIIEKVLKVEPRSERVVLLIQKEVAERIVSEKETVLSLMVKNRAKVKLGVMVSRTEFTPPPKVDSQVIILEPKEPEVSEAVFKLIKLGFSSPRKKLIHNLTPLKSKTELIQIFKDLGIDLNARPADLKLRDYERLFLVV
ncbi:MAG: rRNA adenine dimethyltransferase family protein [Candidatus Saccharibacteria bacterium]|nr:rRNA adenine dimethyltransferase family protein [Candidatus Saccharibacteria bacterium]